jgi:hypothetical protein
MKRALDASIQSFRVRVSQHSSDGLIGRVSRSLDHECRTGVLVEAEETGCRRLTFNGQRRIFSRVDICDVPDRIVNTLLEKIEKRTLDKIGRDGNARLLLEVRVIIIQIGCDRRRPVRKIAR